MRSFTGNNEEARLKPDISPDILKSRLNILVAEDNLTNLKVAHLILKPFISGFESAENGLVAFEKFKLNKFDIIFYGCPDAGYEWLRSDKVHQGMGSRISSDSCKNCCNDCKCDEGRC